MRILLLALAIAGTAAAQGTEPFSRQVHLALTRLARFNRELHLKLGNAAPVIAAAIYSKKYLSPPPAGLRGELETKNPCQACHRGLEVSDKPGRSALLQMADHTTGKLGLDKTACAVCHGRHFRCLGCH